MKRFPLLITLFMLSIGTIFGHPHVYIDIAIQVESMESAKILWTFDLIESQNKIYYFDDDEDGILNETETTNLYNEGFISVRDFNYFITLSSDSTQQPLSNIRDFSSTINDDGRLTVSFYIDLPKTDNDKVIITHLDTSYFVAFSDPDKNAVSVPSGFYSLTTKDKEHPLYYDPSAARTVNLDTSKPQKGWLTAYPTQVIISRHPITGYDQKERGTFREFIVKGQKIFYDKLSYELTSSNNLLFIILLATIYGIIHALGPGHRKVVISSYILSQKSISYIKTVILSFISALIHSVSGILIVLIPTLIFAHVEQKAVEMISDSLGHISYISLLVITIGLLAIKVLESLKKGGIDSRFTKHSISIILLSSIIPCPGAIAIMLFSISMGYITLGLTAVLAMSLGIGLTLSGISLVTLKGKKLIAIKGQKGLGIVSSIIEWVGLMVLLLFAIISLV